MKVYEIDFDDNIVVFQLSSLMDSSKWYFSRDEMDVEKIKDLVETWLDNGVTRQWLFKFLLSTKTFSRPGISYEYCILIFPKSLERLLYCCAGRNIDTLLGDLEDHYNVVYEKAGERNAQRWYRAQVLRSCGSFIVERLTRWSWARVAR